MTTIVYHENIIAVDSNAIANSVIVNSNTNKIIKKNGVTYVVSGILGDADELISAYEGEGFRKDADILGIIDDNGKVYVAGIGKDDGFWKLNITNKCYAIGSGADHAWTAMDLGCGAKEAVRMAGKRDIYTGGRIRTHKVRA